MDRKETISYCLDSLIKAGADKVACSLNISENKELNVEVGEMTLLRTTFNTNMGISVIKDQKKGSTSINKTDKNSIDDAVKLVKRAGKLEKKEKLDKAKNLYAQAFTKLEKAYKSDKKNPDILNYMGFTTRKVGNFNQAEKFYLEGLKIKPNHNGINEYLGELYVQTNQIDKANERLAVLKNCNCDEYNELQLIIKNKGVKIY